jgi:FHS family glucose/mannose:H+ symporter-like MFS transporter
MPRFKPALVVIFSCMAAVLVLPFIRMTSLAPAAYIAAGLMIAPIFPAGLLWMSAARPHRPRDLSILLAGSMIGGALFPALFRNAVAVHGLSAIPALLIGLSMATLAFFGAAAWIGKSQGMSRENHGQHE